MGIRQREFLPREPRVPTTIPCKGTGGKFEGMARNLCGHQHRRRESWLLEPID